MSLKETLQYPLRYTCLVLGLIAMQSGVSLHANEEPGDILQGLADPQREFVSRLCTPLQYENTDDDDGYRQCILQKAELAKAVAQTSSAELSTLPFNERYAIQKVCISSGPVASPAHLQCSLSQLIDLQKEPVPLLSHIMTDEADIVTRQCLEAQDDGQARDYRICVNEEILNLTALPIADFTGRDAQERAEIKFECSAQTTTAGDYRACLLTALNNNDPDGQIISASTTASSVSTTPAEHDTAAANDTNASSVERAMGKSDELAALLAQASDTDDALNSAQTEDGSLTTGSSDSQNDTSENTNTAQNESTPVAWSSRLLEMIKPLLGEARDKFLSLSSGLKAALIFALTLPLLVILIFISRSRESTYARPDKAAQQPIPKAPSMPLETSTGSHSKASRHSKPDLTPTSPAKARDARNTHTSEVTNVEHESELGEIEHNAVHSNALLEPDETDMLDETYLGDISELQSEAASHEGRTAPANLGSDGLSKQEVKSSRWLENHPREVQLEYAIEFLIYWMAYNDKRYDPETKKRVLQSKTVDDRTLIKRLVFMKDAYAFKAAVGLLQRQTNFEQRQQILDLLMALLIPENALTPVQNNLLRFLADAFGIGNAGISQQFQLAYGHPMPAIPRPDKAVWWDQQPESQKIRWDARAIARLPEQIRRRIALGQPLQGDLDSAYLARSYKLAINRCLASRVSKLGEREHHLIESQREKYENTYKALQGEVV